METKFKIGDRIKFIRYKDRVGNVGRYDGHTGEIFEVSPGGNIYVKFDENLTSGPNDYCFDPTECEIELLPAPKFKVGDRVRVTESSYGYFKNAEGVVDKIIGDDVFFTPTDGRMSGGFPKNHLTLVNPPDPRVYNFKVTSPEEIDVQRICDEAPADVNLITIAADKTAGGTKTNGVLIRGVLKSFEFNGVTVQPTSHYRLLSGKKIDLSGWQFTTNRRADTQRVFAPMPEFLERLKKEIEKQRNPAPKKINVKVRYE